MPRFLMLVLLPALLGFSACGIRINLGGEGGEATTSIGGGNGGIFRSVNHGETFEQRVFVEKTKKGDLTIGNTNILSLVFYPADSRVIYAGTREHGAFRTANGGEQWSPFFSSKGSINSIAPHPINGQLVYVAQGNSLYKTEDSGTNWTRVYLDAAPNQSITTVATHSSLREVVYLGTSDGRVLKSDDGGKNWQSLNNFKNRVLAILLQKLTPGRVYVVLATNGIQRSEDGGQFWDEVTEGLQKYSGGKNIRQVALLPGGEQDLLLLATDYGLIRSTDGGLSYEAIEMLTPPNNAPITSLVASPKNGREIYYAANGVLYRTLNGGQEWTTKSLPTARAATALLVDFFNPQILYLGAARIDKK